jgi:hypothetical protein
MLAKSAFAVLVAVATGLASQLFVASHYLILGSTIYNG